MNARQERMHEVLAGRGVWEQKQRLFFIMRHDGVRRVNKPFPTASDAHMPLIDMNVNDMKPFWSAQVFGGKRLTDFVSMKEQVEDVTEAAADYFDFNLRYLTSYRQTMETVLDTMLLRGRGVIMVTTDPFDGHALKFKNIDPLFIIMDSAFNDFEDADEFVWVQHLTQAQYKRNRNYDQSDDTIRSITGSKDTDLAAVFNDKAIREGITHSTRTNEIILWNHYVRTESGWTVYTYSPVASDKHIRNPYRLPYKWQGKASLPFHSVTMEIKDEGWYSPRGIAELNAAFEAYLTKLWNEKSDAMTFGNRPLFTSDKDVQNTGNLRWNPGDFIPGNIQAVQMPAPAFSFAEEINFTRGVAEQRARMPDFGIMKVDGGGGGQKEPRTATENNRIAAMQGVGMDYNGDVLREVRLRKLYTHIWALMLQFRKENLTYYVSNNVKKLPAQALHDEYLVIPDGGAGTKQQRLTQAVTRYTLFKGDPGINQDELKRDVLAADDARLIRRLLIPTNERVADEQEDEAKEIVIMTFGWPAAVSVNEDHVTRIKVLIDWLMAQQQLGKPVDPVAQQRVQKHLAEHIQMLRQINPQGARALIQQIQAMEQAGSQTMTATNGRGMRPAANGAMQ